MFTAPGLPPAGSEICGQTMDCGDVHRHQCAPNPHGKVIGKHQDSLGLWHTVVGHPVFRHTLSSGIPCLQAYPVFRHTLSSGIPYLQAYPIFRHTLSSGTLSSGILSPGTLSSCIRYRRELWPLLGRYHDKLGVYSGLSCSVQPMIAIYPGSFDPITLGHLDIVERGSRLFDQVIVAVLKNPNKTPLFTMEKRLEMIQQAIDHLPNASVDSFHGLTVNYAKIRGATVILRGLRVLSDFEMELQMAHTNKTLADSIETVFLATSNEYSFLSSSVVKEVARFGGSVDHLVPTHVALEIYQRCSVKTPLE